MVTCGEPQKRGEAVPVTSRLGGWLLALDPGGTLVRLSYHDGPSLLHWSDYEFDLGDGRIFHLRGWDECFPTIEAYGESGLMGNLVGRTPVLRVTEECVGQEWTYPHMTARRTFSSPAKYALLVHFEATNTSSLPLEYLWASHALFSVDGLSRVMLAQDRLLDDFSDDGTCAKFFVPSSGPLTLEMEETIVTLSTDQPFWGIWLNRGGWPAHAPAGFCCIGIEATSCDAEIPKGAFLQANELFHGYSQLEIKPKRS